MKGKRKLNQKIKTPILCQTYPKRRITPQKDITQFPGFKPLYHEEKNKHMRSKKISFYKVVIPMRNQGRHKEK